MKVVSRFEADLLHLLHALLGRAPVEGVMATLTVQREPPACLSREAIALIQDALARSFVRRLAREGGWRRERHLRGDRVATGRLWERTAPEELAPSFSKETVAFLIWLACGRSRPWKPRLALLTAGDEFFLFLSYETLRTTAIGTALRELTPFRAHGLCRLAFPDDFVDARDAALPDLAAWTAGLRACILEALQPMLTGRWLEIEREKALLRDLERLIALGRAQETIRDAFLSALDASGRRDLARFLLDAATNAVVHDRRGHDRLDPQILKTLRLAERTQVQRSALFLFETLSRLQAWEREARVIGYFDDGYAAAQLWKSDWEGRDGETLCAKARSALRELSALVP